MCSLANRDRFLAFRVDAFKIRVKLALNIHHMDGHSTDEISNLIAQAVIDATVDGVVISDSEGTILSFNNSAERIFGYSKYEVIGKNVSLLMPEPYRHEHGSYMRNYLETGEAKIIGIGREVIGLRKSGDEFPIDLAVSEVTIEGKRIFTGIVRDISYRRVLEREILKVSELEQRRIGQDLHDGLGQMLTGLGLMTGALARRLQDIDEKAAEDASEIASLIREADEQARSLARGLVPVEVEEKGLAAALARLARNVENMFRIECVVEISESVPIRDASKATHLFRIAQEAVSNAVRHGRAKHVNISFVSGGGYARLRISDDGTGFGEPATPDSGMGINIMRYRARIIGGTLDIKSVPNEGVKVMCTIPIRGSSI
jgi:two-component system CheB/CheR fusion protein